MRKLSEIPLLARRSQLNGTIAQRYSDIRARIERSLERGYQPPREVVLVGASKGQPIDSLKAAWGAGLRVFGENRVGEAERKIPALPTADWHLLGPLQSNKARRAVECFEVIHSLDRVKIARLLDRHATAAGKTLACFLQVNLALEKSKHGFAAEELESAMAELVRLSRLHVVGLMAIPPISPDPEGSRKWFRLLRKLRDDLARGPDWPDFGGQLSMGMSNDFDIAIEEGATHVRVGTSLFGPRPAPAAL